MVEINLWHVNLKVFLSNEHLYFFGQKPKTWYSSAMKQCLILY
jgi:hypothetical protein